MFNFYVDSHHQVFARLHPPECPVSTPAPQSKGQKGLLQAEGLRELGQAGNWLGPLALPVLSVAQGQPVKA